MAKMAQKQQQALLERGIDPVMAAVAAMLLGLGIVMVASSSIEVSSRIYGNPLWLAIKHTVYVGIAVGAGVLTMLVPIKVWMRLERLVLILSFVLLSLVLVPGIGKEVNGSLRWINLGFFTLQSSEFVKFFALVYIAAYLTRNQQPLKENFAATIAPLVPVAGLVLLLLLEPDFGAAVVIMSMVMGLIFLAGVPLRFLAPVVAVLLLAAVVAAVWQPYRVERLVAFSNPWDHQFSSGYQLTQALIAFGRGEWFGLGLGNSIQKQFFLPEAHTDFVFSITAEELGAVGALVIVVLFALLVLRGFYLGNKAAAEEKLFAALMAYGAVILLGVQAIINIGVNIGLLPTKGLTLPFISYGGNSLIVSCMLIGVLLRIAFESGEETKGAKK